MNRPAGNIFIYCDDASHPNHVAVTNFAPCSGLLCPSGWTELPASRAPDGNRQQIGAGRSIVQNAPAQAGWANSEISNADHRNRYELACRKCREPVVVREETLVAALNALAGDGESKTSLSNFAATVKSIST